jgi:hypothetical protein
MVNLVLYLLSEVILDLVVIPLAFLLSVPFLLVAGIFGRRSYTGNVRGHARRLWTWMRRYSFYDVLASIDQRLRRSPGKWRGRMMRERLPL